MIQPCWRMVAVAGFPLAVLSLAFACAPKPPALPAGPGTPFPEFSTAYEQATRACRGIRSITASMALSGKAGQTKLHGRIDAGFAAPAKVRLEGIAPFGRPVFVLTADGDRGTLVLEREGRVIRNAPPDEIVAALAGVRLGAEALRTLVSGCGLSAEGVPAEGRSYANGLAAVALAGGTAYLRRAQKQSTWQLWGETRNGVTVLYSDYIDGRPSIIRLRTGPSGHADADLTLRLSEVEVNTPLADAVFQADIPARVSPMTVEELRRSGPLGGSVQ